MRTIKENKNKNKNSKGRKRQHNNKNYGHNMYKDKIMINKETSQELGNCPMGKREALLKERLY